MSLELHQLITLSKVNIRKKGPADARMLMIDIKLTAIVDAEVLAHFDPTLRHFLFTDDGYKRMRNLKPIGWDGEMAHMEMDIAGERFIGAYLTKFKFDALSSGRVAMSFVASVHPEGRQTAILADLAGDEIEMEIRPEPELDLQPKTAKDESLESLERLDRILEKAPRNADITPAIDGKLPNEHGVYFPSETMGWGDPRKNSVVIDLVELKTGEWLSACAIRIGTSYSSSPLRAFRGARFPTREAALTPIRSKLVDLAARGLDSGLSKAELADLNSWIAADFVTQPKPAKKAPVQRIMYRHPDNDQLTWSGKGKEPQWVKMLLATGAALEVV